MKTDQEQYTKSFQISKRDIYDAYRKVKANGGSAGVDGVTIPDFEKDIKSNLYKIWNRLSSGSYFPSPIRAVEIPKKSAGARILGIPCVDDRIAQSVIVMQLEPIFEGIFHQDSYGYRPNKSALDALTTTRRRCWEYDWVIEYDISSFFDSIDHDLMMKAVERHITKRWVLLYIKRFITAPMQQVDGSITPRTKGLPQGSPLSPVLANLFLHYAIDRFLDKNFPRIRFERYADDGVIHANNYSEAVSVLDTLNKRVHSLQLALNPDKTRIVYCKDSNRNARHENQSFDFLGYSFRPRLTKARTGVYFTSFSPAISNDAAKKIRAEIRSWRLHLRSGTELAILAKEINPIVTGWINYYGRFNPSRLYRSLENINGYIFRYGRGKYKTLKRSHGKSMKWFLDQIKMYPDLFVHWKYGMVSLKVR